MQKQGYAIFANDSFPIFATPGFVSRAFGETLAPMTTRHPIHPAPETLAQLTQDQVEELMRAHAQKRREAEDIAAAHSRIVEDCAVELLRRDPNRRRIEIGELADLTDGWAKSIAKKHRIPTPTSKAGAKERTDERIRELLDADLEMPVVEAASKLGVSPERVRQYIRENNLPARPRRRPSAD